MERRETQAALEIYITVALMEGLLYAPALVLSPGQVIIHLTLTTML